MNAYAHAIPCLFVSPVDFVSAASLLLLYVVF